MTGNLLPQTSPVRHTSQAVGKRQRQRPLLMTVLTFVTFFLVCGLLFLTALYERPWRAQSNLFPSQPFSGSSPSHDIIPDSSRPPSIEKPANDLFAAQSSGVELPEIPDGATLLQLLPCADTLATVPILVNSLFNGSSSATAAYITQHGAANDPDQYFSNIYDIVGDKSVVVSPGLFKTNVPAAPRSFYQPQMNLAWETGMSSWPAGRDAVRPRSGPNALNGASCSSYKVYDALLKRFADKQRFPNLANVYIVGHSGGANIVSRYAQVHDETFDDAFHLRYIVGAAAHQAYFTDARPKQDIKNCAKAFSWPYQFTNKDGQMPPYVKKQFEYAKSQKLVAAKAASSADLQASHAIFDRWMQRDVVMLVGSEDTAKSGTQSCTAKSQGGSARRDRNYAYWAMQNLVAGTNVDVSDFYGYDTLIETGAGDEDQWDGDQEYASSNGRKPKGSHSPSHSHSQSHSSGATSQHQFCIVVGNEHNARELYRSECGLAALRGDKLPESPRPSRSHI